MSERSDRVILLSTHAKRSPAGDEDREVRAGGQDVGEVGRGVGNLLEVVQHQQCLMLADQTDEALDHRRLRAVPNAERMGDGRHDERGIGNGSSIIIFVGILLILEAVL